MSRAPAPLRRAALGAALLGLAAVVLATPARAVPPTVTASPAAAGPAVVEPMAKAAVTGFQGPSLSSTSVLATAKHYVADGGTTNAGDGKTPLFPLGYGIAPY
ncbi:MAG: hypothetical protein HOV83_09590 [Catenulispora sp.]|nr:hypothetical protein [Catenulispora sp.]